MCVVEYVSVGTNLVLSPVLRTKIIMVMFADPIVLSKDGYYPFVYLQYIVLQLKLNLLGPDS